MSNVRIVSNGPHVVGSKVLVDGAPMKGVFKVELSAEASKGASPLWTAVIHCHPAEIEVTDLDSSECEFVRGNGPPKSRPTGARMDRAILDILGPFSGDTVAQMNEALAPSPHLPEPMPASPLTTQERILAKLEELVENTRRPVSIGPR